MMKRALCATAALALFASPACADMMLMDIGGFGSLGVPTGAIIGSTQFSSITDLPSQLILNGWVTEVTFASPLSYYPSGSPSQSCSGTTYICTDTAFPTWSSQTQATSAEIPGFSSPITISVTRPGFTTSGTATTVSDTVSLTGFLRQAYPNNNPVVGQYGGFTVADFVQSKYIFANDIVGTLNFPTGVYTDQSSNLSSSSASVPVANNSTRAYPEPIGAWVTEPGVRYDGSSNAPIEFFADHSYGQGGMPVNAVKITMGDSSGNTVSQLATLGQSSRLPSTTCTATNGSNVLQGCGSIAWVKVGQRLNVPGVPGQAMVGKVDTSTGGNCTTTAPCIELYAQEQATFNTDGSLTIALASGGGSATATQAITGGTTTSFTIGTPTLAPFYGETAYSVTAGKTICTVVSYSAGTVNCLSAATNSSSGSSDAIIFSLPPGTAYADGGFLGQTITEVGSGGLWASATKTIVAPYGTSADSTHSTGTTLTMPTPVQGQWRPNMMLYDNNASPCIPTDVTPSSYNTEFMSAYSSPTATLHFSLLSACNGHVLSGLAIAGQPALTTPPVTSIDISTSATTATSGTDVVQFNQNYQGSTGSITVTSNNPVPVWKATFTPTNFATLSGPSPIYFRAQVYPVVGDQILDTRAPMPQGAQITATASWTTSSTSLSVANCTGINFYDQRGVEVVDLNNSQNIAIATACSGNTLTLASAAANSGTNGDVLAVGVNLDCDWFFSNKGASAGFLASGASQGVPQTCQPSNPAWFGGGTAAQNIANAENVSVNLHHLFGYYDPAATQNFAPRYAFVNSNGTCTTASCIFSSATDPASNASYFATDAAAITAAKSYNNNSSNRSTVHNDTNGIVFCFMPTGSPWALSNSTRTETGWTPLPTLTSVASGGNCPAPGVAGGAPTTVSLKEGSTATIPSGTGNGLRVQNLTISNSGTNAEVLEGNDIYPSTAFPTNYLILDNDIIQIANTPGYPFYKWGAMYGYDLLDNESAQPSELLFSGNSSLAAMYGSTSICGGYNAASNNTQPIPYVMIGNIDWDCGANGGLITSLSANPAYPWPNQVIMAYNRFMGLARATSGSGQILPVSQSVAIQNVALTHNVVEVLNTYTSNATSWELSGDSYVNGIDNVDEKYNSAVGARVNQNYIEGVATTPSNVTTGGSLSNGNFYTEIAYARASNPSVVSSVDSYGAQGWAPDLDTIAGGTSTQSLKWAPPCDFTELGYIYLDQPSGLVNGQSEASFTVATSQGTTTLTTSSVTSLTANLTQSIGSFLGNGTTFALDTTGKPLQVTACSGATCSSPFTLSGTPATAFATGTTYYFMAGVPGHLADVASFTVASGSTGATVTPSTLVGNLYVGATITGTSAQVTACPSSGCGATGSAYNLSSSVTFSTSTTYYAQATALNLCQNLSVIGIDSVTNVAPFASNVFPNRDYFKTRWVDRFNNFDDMDLKADYYSGSMSNGGRVGNWERRMGVEVTGDVYQTPAAGGYFVYSSYGGELVPTNTYFQNISYYDLSAIRYAVGDDRSTGNASAANPATASYPTLNIGGGDYCPTLSTTLPGTTATIANQGATASRVLSGQSAASIDIEGNARLNNGSGWSGAYESTCH